MESYETLGTGIPSAHRRNWVLPAHPFSWPKMRGPLRVEIKRGLLRTQPLGDRLLNIPLPGWWRNFVDTDPDDLRQIAAITGRFGPLTHSAAGTGERLTLWRHLIDDLRQLTSAWTDAGDVSFPATVSATQMLAAEMQSQICEDHQKNGGRFASFSALGWIMDTREMAQWWRLAAIWDVHTMAPLRRCRFCQSWFSLVNQRADNNFCSPRHRSAFHQKRPPPSQPWAVLVGILVPDNVPNGGN